jgi:hypothetical protein
MYRLGDNVELVSLLRSLGKQIGRDRLTGEEQKAARALPRQKNCKVDAVHEGKNDVDDGQVRQPLGEDPKGLFRGVCRATLAATRGKNQSQRIGDRSLIIDDQDPMTVVVHCGSLFSEGVASDVFWMSKPSPASALEPCNFQCGDGELLKRYFQDFQSAWRKPRLPSRPLAQLDAATRGGAHVELTKMECPGLDPALSQMGPGPAAQNVNNRRLGTVGS